LLTLNAGSSSIKFSLFELRGLLQLFAGELANTGTDCTQLYFINQLTKESRTLNVAGSDRGTLIHFLIDWLKMQDGFQQINLIGHRIVHGMKHQSSEKITDKQLIGLRNIRAYDPDHLTDEIKLMHSEDQDTKKHPAQLIQPKVGALYWYVEEVVLSGMPDLSKINS
jgi:acetate kinase